MPISDLLASITGQPNAPTPTPVSKPPTGLKRKLSSNVDKDRSKAVRVSSGSTSKPSVPEASAAPNVASSPATLKPQPYLGNGRPSSGNLGAAAAAAVAAKPNGTAKIPLRPSSSAPRPSSTTTPSKPPAAAAVPSKALPPKKGSFAEILARGRQAHAQMGQVGVIQHKKIEKGSAFRKVDNESSASTAGKRPRPRPAQPGQPRGPPGTGKTLSRSATGPPRSLGAQSRNGTSANASVQDSRLHSDKNIHHGHSSGAAARSKPTLAKKPTAEPVKRFTKAAAATTGYTGTSRPRPGSNAPNRKGVATGGALLQRSNPYGGSGRGRPRNEYDDDDDDDDEEMDDFIEYDDDEEEGGHGPRYDYASDASSDMEAGMDDIDVEERRAEAIARREDVEEQKREEDLRKAKLERKRRALEGRQR